MKTGSIAYGQLYNAYAIGLLKREIFESRNLLAFRWVQTFTDIANTFTKRNPTMHRLHSRIFNDGKLTTPSDEFHEVNSADCV